jgi:hypothetical protein
MPTFSHFKEIWTDGEVDEGASRQIKLRVLVVYDDASEEWFNFGSVMPPEITTYTDRPSVRFPTDFYLLPDESGLITDLAIESARGLLER